MMMMTNPGDIRGAGREVSLHPCHPSYEVIALKSHEVIVILITRALEVPTRMMTLLIADIEHETFKQILPGPPTSS